MSPKHTILDSFLSIFLSYSCTSSLFFKDPTVRCARLVCRLWHHVSKLQYTQSLFFDERTYDPKHFYEVLLSLPYARSFCWKRPTDSYDDPGSWSDLGKALASMSQDGACQRTSVSSGLMSTLYSTLQPLLTLHVIGQIPRWATFRTLLPHLGSLTFLRLDRCRYIDLHINVLLHSSPKLERLHLEHTRLVIDRENSWRLSSLDFTRGARGPWVPSPNDKVLWLTFLTIKWLQVLLSTLANILAICPYLLVFDLIFICENPKRFRLLDSQHIGEYEFMPLIGIACPRLRKFHYSNTYFMFPSIIDRMILSIKHVTE